MKPRQNEAEYQAIKNILQSSDISSREQLDEKIHGMLKAARLYSLMGFMLVVTFIFALPKYSIFIVMIFCLYLAWLWSSTLASKQYFQRYLDETNSSEDTTIEANNDSETHIGDYANKDISDDTNSNKDK